MMKTKITLSDLVDLTGIEERQIQRIAPKPRRRGEYNLRTAVRALVSHLQAKVEKYGESRANAQNREQEAKAALAELALHEKIGNVCSTASFGFAIGELATESRKAIQKAFPKDLAIKILTILSKVRLDKDTYMKFKPTCPRCRIPIFADLNQREYETKKHRTKT
jgi:hypothetical protein